MTAVTSRENSLYVQPHWKDKLEGRGTTAIFKVRTYQGDVDSRELKHVRF